MTQVKVRDYAPDLVVSCLLHEYAPLKELFILPACACELGASQPLLWSVTEGLHAVAAGRY